MPSWRIHRKYGELLGIDEKVQRLVDEFIDNRDHHDFYNFFIEKAQTPKLRIFEGRRVIFYYFDYSRFITSELGRKIEEFGEEGLKCFFLHMFLDIIERNVRYKDLPDVIKFEITGAGYSTTFDVERFVEINYDNIVEDITSEKFRKKDRLKEVEYGMIKGRYKSAVLSTLFRGMRGVIHPYGPKPMYYRKIISRSIDNFLRELKVRGDYDIFVDNLLRNFEKFYDEEIFPEVKEILERYSANEVIRNENLLKEFLRRIFKSDH